MQQMIDTVTVTVTVTTAATARAMVMIIIMTTDTTTTDDVPSLKLTNDWTAMFIPRDHTHTHTSHAS